MLQEPNYNEEIASELSLKPFQVEVVLQMIAEGDTVPFIARYRKERTGNLDEDAIRNIVADQTKRENLYKAKQTAINGIEEQGKLTDELLAKICACTTLKEVEEIYKPYKLKKKTKAMIAIEKGFQPVADAIKEGKESGDIENMFGELLAEYPLEEILEGAGYIIAAEVSSQPELRAFLKKQIIGWSRIISKKKGEKALEKLNEKDTKQIPKFDIYADFSIGFQAIKPYQILALNRGESLGILGVKIEKTEAVYENTLRNYLQSIEYRGQATELLESVFSDGYTALFKSLENEIRGELSEEGEDDAIDTFRSNLDALLMTKPVYGKKILAIDPGYRAGCKIVFLDELGTPNHFDKIFLHEAQRAEIKIKDMITKLAPDVIVLGNGTGVDETLELLQNVTKTEVYIVNESGASVYSASKIAQEEFPDLDSLDRGTISIGRRYIDPLSELVKVPVESIGVGMYQHDMPVKKLEEKLGHTVEDVVNRVGINVNTASSYVLNHIAGMDKRTAKKVFNNRPYKSRTQLQKVLSDKAYEQAIGFLRVPESTEELDNTDIHPEQYALARYYLGIRDEGTANQLLVAHEAEMKELYEDVNVTTLEFIAEAYDEIGQEKRIHSTHKKAQEKVDPDSITEGSIVDGVVRNVVAFGAFVDIGLKNDGLVHVSQIADRFISDPSDELEVGQKVRVKIMSMENGKIQLSIKEAL